MKSQVARNILDFTSDFSKRAAKIRRFEAHPYVDGDTLAEHHHRLQRLLVCIAPHLKREFSKEKDLIEKIGTILTLHDDDEIMVGYDIITQLKKHDGKQDSEEIRDYQKKVVKGLGKESEEFMSSAFAAFRHKNTLAAKIAKALDNIAGNQVLVEQKFGLINPNCAKFTIEYADKVRGASKTTDALIDAQIRQIIEYRKYLTKHPKEVEKLINHHLKIKSLKEKRRVLAKAKELLKIDVLKHVWKPEKTLVPLHEL